MKNQKGMAVGGIILLIVLAVGVLGVIGSYIKYANYGNRSEVNLKKVWTNNQNILGQYTIKVQEIAMVPEMYKNDLKEVLATEMSSRYGAEGSKANMQWIKERSQNFDPSMPVKIQQVVEAGRNEFQAAQTRLIDEKGTYEVELGNVWSGFWLGMAGYPKADLEKYKPVVAKDTAQQFETGVGGPVKLR